MTLVRTDLAHWRALWRSLTASGDPALWHRWLLAAYTASERRYHNVQHLEECLTEFDRVRTSLRHPAAVEIALWFHDAVYDARSTTNEEDSAAAATDCLQKSNVDHATVELVRQLVLSTKTHEPAQLSDGPLLIDIDLAILGQPVGRFWEYERAIRDEYSWVPAETFAEKRTEVLRRFLARPAIYRTELFRGRYESTARTNLESAIARLSSTTR